ncbi:MAG: hypothetical protein L6Q98_18365 [Anaerolineae bacterium]|nr:hypothetical protein [Anaerolineae bacterium]
MTTPPSPPPRPRSSSPILLLLILLVALAAAVFSRRGEAPAAADPASTAEASPAAPGLSGTVIFMSNREGDWDIFTLDLAAGALLNLTGSRFDDGFASYSLDGEQISFLSNEGRAEGDHLGGYLMNIDGSGRARAAADLGTFMSIVMNGRGDWDARGLGGDEAGENPLVLVSLRDLNMEVYVRRGGEDLNLSRSSAIDWYPSWSPDGRQVVFTSDRESGQHDIYIVDAAEESSPRRLTDAPQDDWSPVFTRDGRYILFASERDGLMQSGTLGLYAIDWTTAAADGGIPEAVPVESIADPAEAALDSGAVTQGGITVIMSRRDGRWELYAESAAGGSPINLTNDPGDDLFPLWLPAR